MSIKWANNEGTRLPSGHRLFLEQTDHPASGRWAIADDSGATPEDCDDGILWIDTTAPISIEIEGDDGIGPLTEHISLPLIRQTGGETRTPINMSTALVLAKHLDLTILARGTLSGAYRVR